MELIDIYDSMIQRIGTKDRTQVHKDGDWHKTFHCWFGYCDEYGVPHVILQQRSKSKSGWPGRFDITAAGHYLAGESTEDGIREIEEELGICITVRELVPLGRRVCIEDFGGKKNREFQDVFFFVAERDLTKYRINQDELSGLFTFILDDLIRLYSEEVHECVGYGLAFPDGAPVGSNVEPSQVKVTLEDFIPSLDKYNLRAFLQMRAALRGEKHLHI